MFKTFDYRIKTFHSSQRLDAFLQISTLCRTVLQANQQTNQDAMEVSVEMEISGKEIKNALDVDPYSVAWVFEKDK